MAQDLVITDRVVVPGSDLQWDAVRAGGPGGQNVNKVATKVSLKFDLQGTTALIEPVKARLRALASNRIDGQGRLVVVSQAGRSQADNLEDARSKLSAMIVAALRPPTVRRKTRPTFGSKKRRVAAKRRNAEKKSQRRKVSRED